MCDKNSQNFNFEFLWELALVTNTGNYHARVGQIFKLFESVGTMLRTFSRPALPAGGINKNPTIWLGGA
jgi:hypothetical protein